MYIVCLHAMTPHILSLKLALHYKKGKLPQSILTFQKMSYANSILHTYYYSRENQSSLGQGFPFSVEKLSKVYFLFEFQALHNVSPDVSYANDDIYSPVCNPLQKENIQKAQAHAQCEVGVGGMWQKTLHDLIKKCWRQKLKKKCIE